MRPMADTIQRVSIAVVEQAGCYLVGTRGQAKVLGGLSEFPGGKCLEDEEGAVCAVRECREETGLDVVPVRRLFIFQHCYPHATLDLEFWLCRPARTNEQEEPEEQAIRGGYDWVPAQSLKSLRFPEANGPVIALLADAGTVVG